MNVVVSRAANRDLEAIRQYTLAHSPKRVIEQMDALVASCRTIADGPLR